MSEAGISTDPEKIDVVTIGKSQQTSRAYGHFSGSVVTIADSLQFTPALFDHSLTKGYPPTQTGRKRQATDSTKSYLKVSEPFGERWDQACKDAFKKIIDCLINAPVLAFADPAKPYILHIDASTTGLGAMLNQQYCKGLQPVAFAS